MAMGPLFLYSESHLGHEANVILIKFHFPARKTCIQNVLKFGQMGPEKSKWTTDGHQIMPILYADTVSMWLR